LPKRTANIKLCRASPQIARQSLMFVVHFGKEHGKVSKKMNYWLHSISALQIHYFVIYISIWYSSRSFCYFYRIYFIERIFRLSQISTTSAWNYRVKFVEKSYSCNWVLFKTLSMKLLEISNILFAKNENPRVFDMFFNCIKCNRSLKVMRFVESSWYTMGRLWKIVEKGFEQLVRNRSI
jgi:hypothetical protein